MIHFDDGEFEIAVVTCRRPEFVRGWLDKCYCHAQKRNIRVSIYDSSPDDLTKRVVEEYRKNSGEIEYHRVDDSVSVGYKPMFPIYNSKSEYLWICGDSRYHDFDQLEQVLFPCIKEKKHDYIVINLDHLVNLDDTVFMDENELFVSAFIPSTCIGMSIYRLSLFESLKNDPVLLERCDSSYKDNYGFGHLGYFYTVFSMGKYVSALLNVKTYEIMKKKKVQLWRTRFYGCWAEDLCAIVDRLPDSYLSKEKVLKEVWQTMRLDSFSYCYKARKYGDLNIEYFNKLIDEGVWKRLTNKQTRLKFFAIAPIRLLDFIFICYSGLRKLKLICGSLTNTNDGIR